MPLPKRLVQVLQECNTDSCCAVHRQLWSTCASRLSWRQRQYELVMSEWDITMTISILGHQTWLRRISPLDLLSSINSLFCSASCLNQC